MSAEDQHVSRVGDIEVPESAFPEYTGGRSFRKIIYSADDIASRVASMGADITSAYPPDADLLLVGVLKGSFVFMSDLVRCLKRPIQLDFMVAASYRSGTTTSGEVQFLYESATPMKDRHLIVVEDIVDSGTTLNRLCRNLAARQPASLEVCALLHKRMAVGLEWEPRWVGFGAPNEFLVGNGLDHAESFRNLPFIASLPN